MEKKYAVMDYVTTGRGQPFSIPENAHVVKIEPKPGTVQYRVWYVAEYR